MTVKETLEEFGLSKEIVLKMLSMSEAEYTWRMLKNIPFNTHQGSLLAQFMSPAESAAFMQSPAVKFNELEFVYSQLKLAHFSLLRHRMFSDFSTFLLVLPVSAYIIPQQIKGASLFLLVFIHFILYFIAKFILAALWLVAEKPFMGFFGSRYKYEEIEEIGSEQ